MDGVRIRPARQDEIDIVSDIINDPPNREALAIAGSRRSAVEGARLLVRAGLSLRLEHTVVAERDGAALGVMDAGIESKEPDISPVIVARLLIPVVRLIGVRGAIRLLRAQRVRERVSFEEDPASYYIAELDVAEAHRNQGIGGRLLDYGEAEARRLGAPRMTLTTNITNPARRLYERHAFRVTGTKLDPEFERLSGSPGRVHMTKEMG